MMNESTGAALRHAREQRPLTLQQVSEKTRIRSHYLQALENDDLTAMPSAAQARGFLRIYADFLGLEIGQLVAPAPAASGAATLPSSALTRADNQDAAPGPGTSPPSLWSILHDRWSRRRGGNVEPAGDSASAESPSGEWRPATSSIGDLEEAKKKALN